MQRIIKDFDKLMNDLSYKAPELLSDRDFLRTWLEKNSEEVITCDKCKFRDVRREDCIEIDEYGCSILTDCDYCRWENDEYPNDNDYCSFGGKE